MRTRSRARFITGTTPTRPPASRAGWRGSTGALRGFRGVGWTACADTRSSTLWYNDSTQPSQRKAEGHRMPSCRHLDRLAEVVVKPAAEGCVECLVTGQEWV